MEDFAEGKKTPYEILGLEKGPESTPDEIKKVRAVAGIGRRATAASERRRAGALHAARCMRTWRCVCAVAAGSTHDCFVVGMLHAVASDKLVQHHVLR